MSNNFAGRWQRRQYTRARLEAAVAGLLAAYAVADGGPAEPLLALQRAWADYQAACQALGLRVADADWREWPASAALAAVEEGARE